MLFFAETKRITIQFDSLSELNVIQSNELNSLQFELFTIQLQFTNETLHELNRNKEQTKILNALIHKRNNKRNQLQQRKIIKRKAITN